MICWRECGPRNRGSPRENKWDQIERKKGTEGKQLLICVIHRDPSTIIRCVFDNPTLAHHDAVKIGEVHLIRYVVRIALLGIEYRSGPI
jgi:hypothetical protein